MSKDLIYEVVSSDEKVSARTGNPYIIITAYVDIGDKYPRLVKEFSPVHLPSGRYTVPVEYVIDRSGSLSIRKAFDKASVIRG